MQKRYLAPVALALLYVTAYAGEQIPVSFDCVEIVQGDHLYVCPGESVLLQVSGGSDYVWEPSEDFDDPFAESPLLTPAASQWYYVTGTVGDTVCTDSIFIEIITFEVTVSTADTICPRDEVTISFTSSAVIGEITWNTTHGITDPANTTATTILPLETTEYIVSASIGECVLSDTFSIDVVPFRLDLIGSDSIELCLGESAVISVFRMPPDVEVVWTPIDTTVTVISPTQIEVMPTVTASYTASAMFGECMLTVTTHVRVDSLPDSTLTVVPQKDPYCAGEEIIIFAERADTAKYPDIEFMWLPDDGQILDSANTGNVYIRLQDTTEFFRIMINRACRDTSSVIVNVIPPEIPLSVNDTTLCPGDMFVVEVLDLDVMDIEWMPEQGLSCTQCFSPTVTVQPNPITYMVSGEKDGCPVGAALNVGIFPPLFVTITPDTVFACPGDQISFSFNPMGLSNISLSLSGSGSLSCTNCPDPVVTYGGGTVVLSMIADEDLDDRCGAFGQAIIVMKPDEQQFLSPIQICASEPTSVDLTQYGFVNPMLFLTSGSLSCTDCLTPVVTINTPANLMVTSESQNPDACLLRTTIPLTLPLPDDVEFEIFPDPPYGQGDVISVTLVTTPMAPAGTSYSWSVNGTPVTGTTASNNIPLNEEGLNVVQVEWINSSGCLQQATREIVAGPPSFRIPNAFTPGNPEMNTRFTVEITGNYELTEMLIFNRWGQLVFEGSDIQGWDGRYKGEPAPAEVYVFMITLRAPNGNLVRRKGDLTLIR